MHTELAPRMRPDWRAYGPAIAGLGVGIFGASALWASDPDLAAGLAVQRHSVTSGYYNTGYSSAGCGGSGASCGGGGGGCGGGS